MPVQHTAEILLTHTPSLFAAAVRQAVDFLRAGRVVALPTETVYGLAANALDTKAVSEIYALKGRPAHNPIIVHVASVEMARSCVADWPGSAGKLAAAFWPGPLTLVLPRSTIIPDIVTAGGPTVGIRWPGHPFIQAVIRECGFPLAAPSANPANAVSPTNARHVVQAFGEQVSLIIDGGQAQVGIESTVLDLTALPPRVLRPGMIHDPALRSVIGALNSEKEQGQSGGVLRSPGQLQKHYSPRARLVIRSWDSDADLQTYLCSLTSQLAGCHVIAHTRIPSTQDLGGVSVIPHDAEAFARAIYAELHRCDEVGAEWIIVETPPETAEWAAISDRMKRAAAA
jgi:L-threonylcarbamoyladenylate synthase